MTFPTERTFTTPSFLLRKIGNRTRANSNTAKFWTIVNKQSPLQDLITIRRVPSRQNSTHHLFIYKPTYLGQYKYVTQCKLDFILRLVPVMSLCRPRGVSMSLRVVQLVRPQLTTPYKKNSPVLRLDMRLLSMLSSARPLTKHVYLQNCDTRKPHGYRKIYPQANPQGKRTARSRSTLPDFLPIDFELIACRFDINHESRPLFRTSTKKKANADDWSQLHFEQDECYCCQFDDGAACAWRRRVKGFAIRWLLGDHCKRFTRLPCPKFH